MFNNRSEAGRMLADKLGQMEMVPGVVLAVPRGGVPVGYEVAKKLNLPLEVVLVKKLGHPNNKEYAIGAVSLTDVVVFPHEGVQQQYIDSEVQTVRKKLQQMQQKFVGILQPINLKNKTIIVIDDGVATGVTLMTTLKILKRLEPAKIIVAVPVISQTAAQKISMEADKLVSLLIPQNLRSVGAYYRDFTQVTDEEVMYYLQQLKDLKQTG